MLPEGATEWKPLSEISEFSSAFPITPPPMQELHPQSPAAVEQVSGPAVGLMAVAVIGFVGQAAGIVVRFAGLSAFRPRHGMPDWAMLTSGTVGFIGSLIALAMSLLIFAGGLQMKRLQNYGLAMAASIVAMIPCISPCCLLGLPLGIWALVVLSKPEVKNAFH